LVGMVYRLFGWGSGGGGGRLRAGGARAAVEAAIAAGAVFGVVLGSAIVMMHGIARGLQLGPLVGSEDAADMQEHFGVFLFERSAGVGDLVDLSDGLWLVNRIGVEDGFEEKLLFFERGVHVDELHAALQEKVVDLLLLVGGEADAGYELGVLPPHAVVVIAASKAWAAVVIHEWLVHRRGAVVALRARAALGEGQRCGEKERGCKEETSGHCEFLCVVVS